MICLSHSSDIWHSHSRSTNSVDQSVLVVVVVINLIGWRNAIGYLTTGGDGDGVDGGGGSLSAFAQITG
uniref:Uncharacterized protein n=1 Tax=Globodera rostochiensis TaxID=31243 RepID=A0A914H594_GLORO